MGTVQTTSIEKFIRNFDVKMNCFILSPIVVRNCTLPIYVCMWVCVCEHVDQ